MSTMVFNFLGRHRLFPGGILRKSSKEDFPVKPEMEEEDDDDDDSDDISIPVSLPTSQVSTPKSVKSHSTTSSSAFAEQVRNMFFGTKPTPASPYVLFNYVALGDFTKLGMVVRQVLADPIAGKEYRDLLATDHAAEGLAFLDDLIYHVHQTEGENQQAGAVATLVDTYVAASAPNAINLSDSTRTALLRAYSAGAYVGVADLFERAMYEVFADIKQSDQFREFSTQNGAAKAIRQSIFASTQQPTIHCRLTKMLRNTMCPEFAEEMLLSNSPEEAKLVRLVLAVRQFEAASTLPKQERVALGHKAVATFFLPSSPDFVRPLPAIYSEEISRGDYGLVLEDAKLDALRKLVQNPKLLSLASKKRVRKSGKSTATSCPIGIMAH